VLNGVGIWIVVVILENKAIMDLFLNVMGRIMDLNSLDIIFINFFKILLVHVICHHCLSIKRMPKFKKVKETPTEDSMKLFVLTIRLKDQISQLII
jgi:hypothetical protein